MAFSDNIHFLHSAIIATDDYTQSSHYYHHHSHYYYSLILILWLMLPIQISKAIMLNDYLAKKVKSAQ